MAAPRPLGLRGASIGLRGFSLAMAIALAWLALSTVLAQPWLDELTAVAGALTAWLLIGGIALAPGFLNVFQIVSLLLRPPPRHVPIDGEPPLGILIAAYNEAENIAAALSSLAAQNYRGELEIIVIDDGSTDGTADVVRRDFPHVRLIVLACNEGKAAALNHGLSAVHAPLLVTLDADSWLHPDALRNLVREYISGQPQLAAVAGAVFVSNTDCSWASRLQYWDYCHGIAAAKRAQAAYGGTLVAQGAFSLYRSDILRDIGGWPACVGEDIVVTWAILRRGFDVGYAESALCFTRVPETFSGLLRQRARWARGMIEAFRHHPGILTRRRLTTFLVACSLMFPWLDVAFTFGFIPGVVLAMFGHYWLAGPITLALLPGAAFIGLIMYRTSAVVFSASGVGIRRDLPALAAYTIGYGLINHPAALRGYFSELLGFRKTWGTK